MVTGVLVSVWAKQCLCRYAGINSAMPCRSADRVEMLRTAADGGDGAQLQAVTLDRVDAAAAGLIEDMEDKEQIPDRWVEHGTAVI